MKAPAAVGLGSGQSTWPRTAAFHSASNLMQPWLTDWLLQSRFAGGRRGHPTGYVLLDVEFVTPRNVVYGPGARQELLRHVGEQLHDMLRGADYGGHLTSGELLILMPGEGEEGASAVARRLTEALDGATLPSGRSLRARAVSFAYRPDFDSPEEMLEEARGQLPRGEEQGGPT